MLSGGVLKRRRVVSLARLFSTSYRGLGRGVSDQTPLKGYYRRTWKNHATLKLEIASHTMYKVRYSALEIT
jgi:hypothetical protein